MDKTHDKVALPYYIAVATDRLLEYCITMIETFHACDESEPQHSLHSSFLDLNNEQRVEMISEQQVKM